MGTIEPFQQWGDRSECQMVDIGEKMITARRAIAQGKIKLSKPAFDALATGANPKGNVLAAAEIAGVMAVKRTAEIIPLCHPISTEKVKVSFELREEEHAVLVHCEVRATAKTGVEMEALMGVQTALLTLYDFSKAVDPDILIQEIRLVLKEGGKSGVWVAPSVNCEVKKHEEKKELEGVLAAVLTISDRCYSGNSLDRSGPALANALKGQGAVVKVTSLVPDEREAIQAEVQRLIRQEKVRLILTTGGTGLAPRDLTPESILEMADKEVPGLAEYLRSQGSKSTPLAWLSRGVAVLIQQTLVITLPGSEKAVLESVGALETILPHALHIGLGGDHSGSIFSGNDVAPGDALRDVPEGFPGGFQ